jgi:alpha-tubulin suppressor-like RCC1 family protein
MFAWVTDENKLFLSQSNKHTEDLDLDALGLRMRTISGGNNHMTFLMERVSTKESVVYRYGADDLGACERMTTNALEEWPMTGKLQGKHITMMACGGYHTLFLIDKQVYVR